MEEDEHLERLVSGVVSVEDEHSGYEATYRLNLD